MANPFSIPLVRASLKLLCTHSGVAPEATVGAQSSRRWTRSWGADPIGPGERRLGPSVRDAHTMPDILSVPKTVGH